MPEQPGRTEHHWDLRDTGAGSSTATATGAALATGARSKWRDCSKDVEPPHCQGLWRLGEQNNSGGDSDGVLVTPWSCAEASTRAVDWSAPVAPPPPAPKAPCGSTGRGGAPPLPARAWATMAAKEPVGWGEGPGDGDAPCEDAAARGLSPPPEVATAAAATALPSFCRFRTARARSRAALALRSSLHRGSTWQQQGTQRVSNNHLSPHGRQPHSLTPHALSMQSRAPSVYIRK